MLTANEENIPHKFNKPERRSKERISLNPWMVKDKTNNWGHELFSSKAVTDVATAES